MAGLNGGGTSVNVRLVDAAGVRYAKVTMK